MPRIIALQGKASSGKTTAINLLPAILLAHGYRRLPGMHQSHGADFLDVFEKSSTLISVTSTGDTHDMVHDRLSDLVAAGCDTCICACRTYDRVPPGTVAAVQSFPGYAPHFVSKTYAISPSMEPAVNGADANTIFGML